MTTADDAKGATDKKKIVHLPAEVGLRMRTIIFRSEEEQNQFVFSICRGVGQGGIYAESKLKFTMNQTLVVELRGANGNPSLAIGRITHLDKTGFAIEFLLKGNEKVNKLERLVKLGGWQVATMGAEGLLSRKITPAQNKSIYVKTYLCRFHKTGNDFEWYALKARTQTLEPNFFGVGYYKEPLPGKEYCNYSLLQVKICPQCFFASFSDKDFDQPDAPKDERDEFEKKQLTLMAEQMNERVAIFSEASATISTENRSYDDAQIALRLAIHSAETMCRGSVSTHQYKHLLKMGELYLVSARLYEEEERHDKLMEQLRTASEKYKAAFQMLKMPETASVAFRITAISVYLGEDKEARKYLKVLDDLRRARLPEPDNTTVNKFFTRARDSWDSRDFHRHPGFTPPDNAGSPEEESQ